MVPLFNEARGLPPLHERIGEVARRLKAARGLPSKSFYVDDGSKDATNRIAQSLPADALDVQVVALSRNFGKEAALLAGLDHARFGAVLFMDGDGQHPPELIETLVARWLDDGYDVVYTAKAHRDNEPRLRRAGVRTFYALINWGARHKIPGRRRRLPPAVAARRRGAAPVARSATASSRGWRAGSAFGRCASTTSRPSARMAKPFGWGSLLGLSIEGLTSFSVAPLRLASLLGVAGIHRAVVRGQHAVRVLVYGVAVPGYPSVVVGLMVLGGVQLDDDRRARRIHRQDPVRDSRRARSISSPSIA